MTLPADILPFPEDESSIDARFVQWLKDCPSVWPLYVRTCEQVRAAGFLHYSSDAVGHRLRWFFNIEQRDGDFKINNDFTSRLARKLLAERPDFAGFFELRRLRA